MIRTAAHAAADNVRINLGSVRDRAFADRWTGAPGRWRLFWIRPTLLSVVSKNGLCRFLRNKGAVR
ncbi:hypothetical protein [Desulfonema ishimotonii]|uniref:hypothetical protein n=1 Tax=Desulfonema ishimotonii TaxID=45657 RepID=UPI000F56B5E0|nr:hypothetical protein [Desulfonema ishimotonii]